MRIYFDHQIFSLQKFGGISRYFVELAFNLSENNHVKIDAPLFHNQYLSTKKSLTKGIYIPFCFKGSNTLLFSINSCLNNLSIQNRSQILHETYYEKLSPKGKYKKVITIHDMNTEIFPSKATKLISNQKKRAAIDSDHIICVSKNTQKDLINYFNIPIEKTTVVYHGFTSIPVDNTRTYIIKKKPFILFVGRRSGYKNFLNFIKSYSFSSLLVKNFDIYVFGDKIFNKNELKLLHELRVEKNVQFFSGDDALLANLYSNASLFVYPSLYEGFGMPLLEAVSYGCPVLCSNTSCFEEVLGTAAIYFNPNDLDEMKGLMEFILLNESSQDNCKIIGKERLKNFSWKKCALETEDVYKKII